VDEVREKAKVVDDEVRDKAIVVWMRS